MAKEIKPGQEQGPHPHVVNGADVAQFNHVLNCATSNQGTTFIMPYENDGLRELITLAEDVVNGTEPWFQQSSEGRQPDIWLASTRLNRQLLHNAFISQVSRDLEYAPYIELAVSEYAHHAISFRHDWKPDACLGTGGRVWESYNHYLETTRSEGVAIGVKRRNDDWQRNAKENEKTLIRYINRISDQHDIIVVQMALTHAQSNFNNEQGYSIVEQLGAMYMNDLCCYRWGHPTSKGDVVQRVGFEEAHGDRNRLFANRSRKPRIFAASIGYVCSMQWSRVRGWFLNCTFLFDGNAESRHHTVLGDEIGQYWVNDVTGGRGDYRSGNRDGPMEYVVGMVERDDLGRRAALTRAIGFPLRVGRYVRVKHGGEGKLFTMGRMPPLGNGVDQNA